MNASAVRSLILYQPILTIKAANKTTFRRRYSLKYIPYSFISLYKYNAKIHKIISTQFCLSIVDRKLAKILYHQRYHGSS